MKGIELGTGDRMSQVIAEITGAGPDRIAVISGPNLAPEIAARQYCATVVACADEAVADQLQKACHTGYFRPYTNPGRGRLRARRRGQERDRDRRRHRRRAWGWATTPGRC